MIDSLSNYDKINLDFIINNIHLIKLLEKIKPLSCFLFGSFAKNKYHQNSDIDFLIIFKNNKNNIDDIILKLKNNIFKIFNKKIDIVVMIHKHFLQYFEDNYDIDTNFVYNVYNEAINIYGQKDKDLIIESIKYKKY